MSTGNPPNIKPLTSSLYYHYYYLHDYCRCYYYKLCLERVHLLTSSQSYRLRIEIQQEATGHWYSAEYWSFTVSHEASVKVVVVVDIHGR